MDKAAVARWLANYVSAWKTYDPEAIGALFNDDAVYRWHPWGESDDAVHGREAIVASWLEDQDDRGSWTAEYTPWAVEGDRAVARGISRYFATADAPEAVYHNVFLLQFDGAGRCAEFTDVYMRQPD